MFISTVAKTLSKIAKFTPMVRRKTAPTESGGKAVIFTIDTYG